MKKLLIAILLVVASNIMFSQPGTLDNTFAKGGMFLGKQVGHNITASFVQADGKILCAGTAYGAYGAFIFRMNSNGTPDSTFGVHGYVSCFDLLSKTTELNDMQVTQSGRILITGSYIHRECCTEVGFIAALTPVGLLDATFGNSGYTIATDTLTEFFSMAVQTNGKIVTCGKKKNLNKGGVFGYEGIIARFNSNGLIDSTFGDDGYVIYGDNPYGSILDPYYSVVDLTSVKVQADGKIVAAGNKLKTPFILRLNSNGDRDGTFGAGGEVNFISPIDSFTHIKTLHILNSGKILVTGYNDIKKYKLGVEDLDVVAGLLDSRGLPDNTFGVGGWAIYDLYLRAWNWNPSSTGRSIIQPDGKIVITGIMDYYLPGKSPYTHEDSINFAMIRLNSNGTKDNTFGNRSGVQDNPIFDHPILIKNRNYVNAISIAPDGKIVLVGNSARCTSGSGCELPYLSVARYNNDIGGIMGVNRLQNDFLDLNIFPNPVLRGGAIELSFNHETKGELSVVLFSSLGQLVIKQADENISPGTNKILMDIPMDISPGLYFIEITVGEGKRIEKIVID